MNTRKQRENVSTGGTSQSSPFHVGWKFIAETIKQKSWGRLWIGDQLLHAQRQGKCLFGFQELPLQFPPSFKREKVEMIRIQSMLLKSIIAKSVSQVIPIACSSNLFLDSRRPGKRINTACHGVTPSDHAPVCATFSVNLLLGTSEHEDANDEVLGTTKGRRRILCHSDC